jgi:hypothetical protein
MINESTLSTDLVEFASLEKKIFERIYSNSLASNVCSVQRMKTPTDFVYSFYTSHHPEGTNNSQNFSFIMIDKSLNISVGDTLTTSTGKGIVRYFEKLNILIDIYDGSMSVGQDIKTSDNSSAKIKRITKNISSIIFAFSRFFESNEITIPNSIDLSVKRIKTTAISKKIKTQITREVLEDIKFLYPTDFEDKIAQNLSQVVIDEIDREIIFTLKDISTILPTLALDSNDLPPNQDIPSALFSNLNLDIMSLNSIINRGLSFEIIMSPKVAGYLLSSIQSSITSDKSGTGRDEKYIGTLSGYDCYVDNFADEDYYMIFYNSEKFGDSTLILGNYKDKLYFATDYETGKETLFYLNRKSICRNPQDTGSGLNDSIFSYYRTVTF